MKTVSSSPGLNACLARNWWAVGLRGILAVAFGLAVLALPSPTLASLIVWFAAYLAAPEAMPREWTARAGEGEGARAAADYIAGMTDRFALGEYRRLFDPDANLR